MPTSAIVRGRSRWEASLLALATALVVAQGCSRKPANVAPVTGKVTLGGQPLAGALITFSPVGNGSSSLATTDSEGKYKLMYSGEFEGAETGDYTVWISTFREAGTDSDPPTPEIPEKVPYAYRQGDKQLKATVNPGKNEINFDLQPGPINPPQVKGKKGVRPRPGACT